MMHPLEQLAATMRQVTPDTIGWNFEKAMFRDEATLRVATTLYAGYSMNGLVAFRLNEKTAGAIMANIGEGMLRDLRDEMRRQADELDKLITPARLISYGPLTEPRHEPVLVERCDICNNTGIDYIGRPCESKETP